MHIAGGVYRELCDIPGWDAEFGSGGRAAAAVSALSPGSTLHTYAQDPHSAGIVALEALGIKVRAHSSRVRVAIAYFHPLSRSHIEPPVRKLAHQSPIRVSGETVLRFGFLEGEAVVDARRAIYDPQTSTDPQPFDANGSTAGELALVTNELELRTMASVDDTAVGAERVIQAQRATVVVVKSGAKGATVFERSGAMTHVPAYHSGRVFKIGTGDVFSAIFAFYWGEAGRPAREAADLASRSVAAYCTTRRLPLLSGATDNLRPIVGSLPGLILLEGAASTIGQRYVMEEARFHLSELGATVVSPALEGATTKPVLTTPSAMLVMVDGVIASQWDRVRRMRAAGVPVVVFAEQYPDAVLEELEGPGFTITDDFTSALYFAVWAAMAEPAANLIE